MQARRREARRVLRPLKGSAVFILQPNYEKIGKTRLWLWEFLLKAAKEWNLVQPVFWLGNRRHAPRRDEPQAGTSSPKRENGGDLARGTGPPPNQDGVLWNSHPGNVS